VSLDRSLFHLCNELETHLPKTNSEIFSQFDIPPDYPWREKMTDNSNMYACLYALADAWAAMKVLEVGTGFGLSAMAFVSGVATKLVSLDIGNFMGMDNSNMADRVLLTGSSRCDLWEVDTQNFWMADSDLVAVLVEEKPFDLLYIDGKHKGDGLFKDLYNFWPFVHPGGLIICDDIHDPAKYPQYDWVPDTWNCFNMFLQTPGIHWNQVYRWDFPFVPSGRRPLGLIIKTEGK